MACGSCNYIGTREVYSSATGTTSDVTCDLCDGSCMPVEQREAFLEDDRKWEAARYHARQKDYADMAAWEKENPESQSAFATLLK